MKLKGKIALITVAVLILVLSSAFLVLSRYQSSELKKADETLMQKAMKTFSMNLNNVFNYLPEDDVAPVTERSLFTYAFSRQAAQMSDDVTWYSAADDEMNLLYSRCPYDLETLLKKQLADGAFSQDPTYDYEPVFFSDTFQDVLVDILVQKSSLYKTRSGYIIITKNVSETYRQIHRFSFISSGLLILAASLSLLILLPLLKRSLDPVTHLTETTRAIAGGDYSLRIRPAVSSSDASSPSEHINKKDQRLKKAYESQDEVGELSRAFDAMADAVEDKISSLDEENRRKELLLGALSHELRTPMTVVTGYAESLVSMPLTKEMQEESALKILEAGRHAEALSQKMMDIISLSRQPELTKTAVKTTELKRIIEDFFPKKTAFQITAETVCGDQTLIVSLLTNLVQNAVRASAENDVVEVSISEEENAALIRVTDHGRGIPKEHLPYLTDPFYRVDKARSRKEGGAGLGLTLCSMIAEAHGGDFLIESEAGKGTIVTVKLPSA